MTASPSQAYSKAEILDLRSYARARGVALVVEIDVPSHALGWERAFPDGPSIVAARCKEPSPRAFPNCRANLDPTQEATYDALRAVLRELEEDHVLGGSDVPVHLGGR